MTAPAMALPSPTLKEESHEPLAAPPVLLLAAWRQALRRGNSMRAAEHRQLLEELANEDPTWEDAEWR